MNERLRNLRDEYRPSMTEEVLRAWAEDVVAELNDLDAPKRCPGCGATPDDFGLTIHEPDCGWG